MISIISIIPIVVAGISGSLGLFVLFISFRRKTNPVQIIFGLTALTVTLYGIATALLYNSTNLIQATTYQRIQVSSIALFLLAFFFLITYYLDLSFWKKNYLPWVLISAITIIPQIFIKGPLIWNSQKSSFYLINFFGSIQVITESEPGIITQITYGIGFLAYLVITIIVTNAFKNTKDKFKNPLFLSTFILLFAFLNDTFFAIGIIKSVYILELAFLIIILFVALMFSKNILDAIATKEALELANIALQNHKVILEKTVSERTHAYQYQAEYFRAMVDNNPIATVTLDNSQRILSVNPAFEELFGYTREEALTQELDSLIAPEEQFEEARDLTLKVLGNQKISSRGVRKQKNGGRVDVEILGVPVMVNNTKVGVLGLYRDISNQIKAEKILKENEMRYRSLFEDSPISLWEEDFSELKKEIDKLKLNGVRDFHKYFSDNPDIVLGLMKKITIINVNQATIKLFKANSKEDFFHGIEKLMVDSSVAVNAEIYARLAEGANQHVSEIQHKDFTGKTFFTALRLAIAPGYEDTWEKVFISIIDITERKNNESYLEYLSTHDQLTGVANRILLYDRLQHAMALAARDLKMVAVFFIDLDGYKEINDQFGHLVGDKLLVQIANQLKKNLRESDTIARFGGDEFILILENIVDHKSVRPIAEKIRNTITQPYQIDNHECFITASFGISVYPIDGTTAEELINKADTAMYSIKDLGKNHYKFANNIFN